MIVPPVNDWNMELWEETDEKEKQRQEKLIQSYINRNQYEWIDIALSELEKNKDCFSDYTYKGLVYALNSRQPKLIIKETLTDRDGILGCSYTCPECKGSVKGDSHICSHCGQKLIPLMRIEIKEIEII